MSRPQGKWQLKLHRNGPPADTGTNVKSVTDDRYVFIGAWGWWTIFSGLIDQSRLLALPRVAKEEFGNRRRTVSSVHHR